MNESELNFSPKISFVEEQPDSPYSEEEPEERNPTNFEGIKTHYIGEDPIQDFFCL
jgi:hypothetical protein